MKNIPLILEAERRGVIRPDDQAFLAEGRRRKLPEFGSIVAEKPKQSIAEWEAQNSPRPRVGFSGGFPGMYMETQPKQSEWESPGELSSDVPFFRAAERLLQKQSPKSLYRKAEEAVEGTPLEGVTKAVGLADLGIEMGTNFLAGAPAGAVVAKRHWLQRTMARPCADVRAA